MKCYTCFYKWEKSESETICNHKKSNAHGLDIERHQDEASKCNMHNRGFGKDCEYRQKADRLWNTKSVYRCFSNGTGSYRCGANAICTSRVHGTLYKFTPKQTP